ncbi:mechanosensitive ion channel family protein [Planosporangium thailandense]|uniref:Mechanosensitive ion channel family protein n=1 Tax=Planosporangium thailandense TaxID=765197 RepID=A0ABX0XWY9_9ACTN|nr:mechanosensitive ion channel family protein [Planosporangium thailandense]NJC70573.1 mechanosensitive ion channel family protein [Planosporangium thailandense]
MSLAIAPITDITTWMRSSGLEIVLFLSGAILLARFIRWLGDRITRRIDAASVGDGGLVRSEASKHRHALTQVIMWSALVLVYCVCAALILQRLGVPVTGLVAPAAVAGVALGFGAQRIVQDVLAGIFIIAERQYGYGDMVRIAALGSEAGVSGTVEEVTLRITRMRSANGEVIIVPNGQIVQVINMSRDWARAVIDIPVPSSTDINQVQGVLRRVGDAAAVDERLGPLLLGPPSVLGVESIEVDTLHVRIVARTLPGKQFEAGRELRSRVAAALRQEGVVVAADVDTAHPTGAA